MKEMKKIEKKVSWLRPSDEAAGSLWDGGCAVVARLRARTLRREGSGWRVSHPPTTPPNNLALEPKKACPSIIIIISHQPTTALQFRYCYSLLQLGPLPAAPLFHPLDSFQLSAATNTRFGSTDYHFYSLISWPRLRPRKSIPLQYSTRL